MKYEDFYTQVAYLYGKHQGIESNLNYKTGGYSLWISDFEEKTPEFKLPPERIIRSVAENNHKFFSLHECSQNLHNTDFPFEIMVMAVRSKKSHKDEYKLISDAEKMSQESVIKAIIENEKTALKFNLENVSDPKKLIKLALEIESHTDYEIVDAIFISKKFPQDEIKTELRELSEIWFQDKIPHPRPDSGFSSRNQVFYKASLQLDLASEDIRKKLDSYSANEITLDSGDNIFKNEKYRSYSIEGFDEQGSLIAVITYLYTHDFIDRVHYLNFSQYDIYKSRFSVNTEKFKESQSRQEKKNKNVSIIWDTKNKLLKINEHRIDVSSSAHQSDLITVLCEEQPTETDLHFSEIYELIDPSGSLDFDKANKRYSNAANQLRNKIAAQTDIGQIFKTSRNLIRFAPQYTFSFTVLE